MGAVVDKNVFKEVSKDVEGYFYSQVETNENLKIAMKDAVRVNEFKTEGDYSYSLTKFAGDGYVMIGDAARFVDPIFSSGVSIALYSAKYASERIQIAIEQQNFSEEILKPYEVKLRSGVEVWYEFIRLYYKLLPLFTYFIQNKQHRLQVLQLLQGEVYNRGEVPVLKAMRDFIEKVEKSDNHLFKGKLTNISIDDLPEIMATAE